MLVITGTFYWPTTETPLKCGTDYNTVHKMYFVVKAVFFKLKCFPEGRGIY